MRHEFEHRDKKIVLTLDNPHIEAGMKNPSKHPFYEGGMLDYIADFDNYEGVYVDCGAYIGNHTVYFSKYTKATKIHAFEPVWHNELQQNVDDNGCENVIVHPLGLAGRAGERDYYIRGVDDNNAEGNTAATTLVQGKGLKVERLDSFGLKDVKLIKMDVEFMEISVLKGARKTIDKYKPVLYIEIGHKQERYDEISEYLRSIGYRLDKKFNATPTYRCVCI